MSITVIGGYPHLSLERHQPLNQCGMLRFESATVRSCAAVLCRSVAVFAYSTGHSKIQDLPGEGSAAE